MQYNINAANKTMNLFEPYCYLNFKAMATKHWHVALSTTDASATTKQLKEGTLF